MRSWYPISPRALDRKRLLGEHAELHAIFSIITNGKTGYANHPEVNRWRNHLNHLVRRHNDIAEHMSFRGFKHKSPMHHNNNTRYAQPEPKLIEPLKNMWRKLKDKQS